MSSFFEGGDTLFVYKEMKSLEEKMGINQLKQIAIMAEGTLAGALNNSNPSSSLKHIDAAIVRFEYCKNAIYQVRNEKRLKNSILIHTKCDDVENQVNDYIKTLIKEKERINIQLIKENDLIFHIEL